MIPLIYKASFMGGGGVALGGYLKLPLKKKHVRLRSISANESSCVGFASFKLRVDLQRSAAKKNLGNRVRENDGLCLCTFACYLHV